MSIENKINEIIPGDFREAKGFYKYLNWLDKKLSNDLVAVIADYLTINRTLLCDGQQIEVTTLQKAGKKVLMETTETEKKERYVIKSKTVENFHIPEMFQYLQPVYSKIKRVQECVQAKKKELRQEYGIEDSIIPSVMRTFSRKRDYGIGLALEKELNLKGYYPGGFSSNMFFGRSAKSISYALLFIAGAAAATIMYTGMIEPFLTNMTRGFPPEPERQLTENDKNSSGRTKWNPGGKPGKIKVDAPKKSPKKQKKKTNLDDLKRKHRSDKDNDYNPPRKIEDVISNHSRHLADMQFKKKDNRSWNRPQAHIPFKTKGRSLPTYEREQNRDHTPEKPPAKRPLVLLFDVSDSMSNPLDILEYPNTPSPSFWAAMQIIKNYTEMGAPVSVIKFPVQNLDGRNMSPQITSKDALFQYLLYHNSIAKNDKNSVEKVMTLYLTQAKKRGLPPADIVVLTDEGPTCFAGTKEANYPEKSGYPYFSSTVSEHRPNDRVHWFYFHNDKSDRGGRYYYTGDYGEITISDPGELRERCSKDMRIQVRKEKLRNSRLYTVMSNGVFMKRQIKSAIKQISQGYVGELK